MAAAALTATVLIRIGNGRASEVGTFDIPLRAVVNRDADGPFPGAFIDVDLVAFHEGFRAARGRRCDSGTARAHDGGGRMNANRNDPAYRAGYKFGYRVIGPLLCVLGSAVITAAAIGFGRLVGAW